MALQGDYNMLEIPDLLNLICTRRFSGLLVLANREEHRSFEFRNGDILSTLSNEPGQLLGEILVRELDVDPGLVEEIAADPTTGFLGAELVARQVISRQDLDRLMDRKIRATMRQVLRWKEWAFHFEPRVAPKDESEFHVATQLLIFDLSRELDEWRIATKLFPEGDVVLSLSAGSSHHKLPDGWRDDFPPIGEVLQDVDGTRTVRQLLQESPLPVRAHAEALAVLVHAGILQVHWSLDLGDQFEKLPQDFVLPVIPNLPVRILQMRDVEASMVQCKNFVWCDPVLAARVIQLASTRETPEDNDFSKEALFRRVGLPDLKSMFLADAMRGLFLAPSDFSWGHLWEDAYISSILCTIIAERVNFPNVELAQLAGLLHDLGAIFLAAQNHESYRQVYDYARATGTSMIAAEEQGYLTNHCNIGEALARRWKFPRELVRVIREHHSPVQSIAESTLLNIVRLSNHLIGSGGADAYLDKGQLKKVIKHLGLSSRDVDELVQEVENIRFRIDNDTLPEQQAAH